MSRTEWGPEHGSYSLELVPPNSQLQPEVKLTVLPSISDKDLRELKRFAVACGVDPQAAITHILGSAPSLVLLPLQDFSLVDQDLPEPIQKLGTKVTDELDYIVQIQNISPIEDLLFATEQLVIAGHIRVHEPDKQKALRRLLELERSGETDIVIIKQTIVDYWITADVVAPE